MPRKPRVDYPGAWHHVMNRGARKQPIFAKYNDAITFLEHVGDTVQRYGVEVHAFALMPNHYHLLMRTPKANLSRAMRFLGVRYTQSINARYHWDGPIFRGRFHSQHIGDDEYLDNVLAYIHLNPVRAGIVKRPEDSEVTSYRAYAELQAKRKWLTTETLTERMGGASGVVAHTAALLGAKRPWLDGFDDQTGWIMPTHETPPPAAQTKPLPETGFRSTGQVMEAIAALVGKTRKELMKPHHGRGANKARRFAVWALTEATDLTQGEIAGVLGCTSSSVSVTLHRARTQGPDDPVMAEWMKQWPPA